MDITTDIKAAFIGGLPQGIAAYKNFVGWARAGTARYIVATGGVVTRNGDWLIHTFNNSGSFVVTQLSNQAALNTLEYLVIAGGGSGGSDSNEYGGGGGAGGYRTASGFPVAIQSYVVTIGAGGPAVSLNQKGINGSDSSFDSIISDGGGGGGGTNGNGEDGGSGGGASYPAAFGLGVVGQGNDGGLGINTGGGGGGGGAGAVGQNGVGGGTGGNGGGGTASSITGESVTRAGGGGGGGAIGQEGAGGSGGGGIGGGGSSIPGDGGINTGGGGGGGISPFSTGGSGVVVVAYYSPQRPFPSNLSTGLISQWKLNGNSNDSIGSNNGVDTAVTYSQGKVNQGAVFNGSTSRIQVNDSTDFTLGNSEFIYSMFVKRTVFGVRQVFFGQMNSAGDPTSVSVYAEFTVGNKLLFSAFDGATGYSIVSSSSFADFNQHFILFQRRAGMLELYIDNVLEGTFNIGSNVINDSAFKMGFGIAGEFDETLNLNLTGQMDEINFWKNRSFDSTERTQLYNYYNT